ncbi:hypothetical protein [Cohnella sp.]|uniref:hypothetical protein n=1 Tax=Cohnella sp. TaxID=1883426 RepID=UPI00356B4CC5
MAKTNWQMNEVVQPADLNQIGQEINDLADEIEGATTAMPGSLVKRDEQGRAKIANPTADDDIANKGSVEAAIASAITNLVNGSPTALDTLMELAAALGNDPNFATTVTNALAAKVNKAGDTMTGQLVLPGDPTLDSHAARKRYVDDKFGAKTTEGVLDWNDVTNVRPGAAATLLRGNAANGPSNTLAYFHPFNFEYATKTGAGNISQLAIPYALTEPGTGIYMRTRYLNVWSGWQKLLTSADIRVNSGALEYYDGTGWKRVGGGVSVPSNTVKKSFDTLRAHTGEMTGMLVAVFIPEALGEVEVSFELRRAVNGSYSANLIAFNTSIGENVRKTAVDYRTPIGTVVSGVNITHAHPMVLGQESNGTWKTFNVVLGINTLQPVYFFIGGGSVGSPVPSEVRNIKIKYDVVQ